MRTSVFTAAVARYLMLTLLFALPFFVIPVSWAAIPQAKMLLTVVVLTLALLCYVAGRLLAGMAIIPRHAILGAALLLPLAYCVSAVFSGASIDSYVSGFGDQETVASMVVLCTALLLVATLFSGKSKNAMLPLFALLCGGGVVIVFQIARLALPSALSLGGALAGSASSIVGGWHDLGIFSALLLYLSIALSFDEDVPPLARIYLGLLALTSFFMLVVSGLSDIWYALAVLFALQAVYGWVSVRARSLRRLLLPVMLPFAIALVCAGLGYGSGALFAYLPGVLRVENVEVRPSWQSTYVIGEKVFSGGQAIFGSGPDTFADLWSKWKPLSVNTSTFWNTDFRTGVGLIPTAFVTAGVLGVFAWLALMLAVVYRVFASMRVMPERRALHGALLGGSLLLLSFHVIYSPSFAISLVLFLMLGLIVALDTSDVAKTLQVPLGTRTAGQWLALLALIALVWASLLSCYFTARAIASDLLVSKAATDYAAGKGLPNSLALIEMSLNIYPSNTVAHRAAVQAGLIELQTMMQQNDAASTAELQATLKRTIDQGLAAVSIDSKDYQNWLSLAGLYQQLANSGVPGAYENALDAYKKAAAINPTNPLPLLNAGDLSLALNDATSAISFLDAALALKPDLASGYYLRSQAKAAVGSYDDALRDAKQAIALAIDDPVGWYNLGVILYTMDDYSDSIVALSKAISLQNDYANAYFVLSLDYDKSGEREPAIEAMQKVVELNPHDPTATRLLATLQAASSTAATSSPAGRTHAP